jgi:hypothetical protein
MASDDYVRLTGDRVRTEAALTLADGADVTQVRAEFERRLPAALRGRLTLPSRRRSAGRP